MVALGNGGDFTHSQENNMADIINLNGRRAWMRLKAFVRSGRIVRRIPDKEMRQTLSLPVCYWDAHGNPKASWDGYVISLDERKPPTSA